MNRHIEHLFDRIGDIRFVPAAFLLLICLIPFLPILALCWLGSTLFEEI